MKTSMAWILTALLVVGCAAPTEIRVGPATGSAVPVNVTISELNDPEYERHQAIPLSFIIRNTEVSPDGRESINWSDAPKAYVLLDSTLVIFNAEATTADIDQFLQDFDAEVTGRVVPDGKDFKVKFNLRNVVLDHDLLLTDARAAGYSGEIVMSSLSAAKFLQVFCQATKVKDAYNIFGIGMATDGDLNED